MTSVKNFRRALLIGAASLAVFACSQGSSITSPGATSPGTGTGTPTPTPTPGGTPTPAAATCASGFNTLSSVAGQTVCEITGNILTNLTVPYIEGVSYRINGRVNVGTDAGVSSSVAPDGKYGRLTIEPGVTLFGESGADFLVVNRGSQIFADGTASAPIIFTSRSDLERRNDTDSTNDFGGDSIGEWGGVVLLGDAPINRCLDASTPGSAGCNNVIEGVTAPEAVYGGNDAFDNSGSLQYVQVRFAGFEVSTGKELNGISFGGVGSGTTVNHIQVHNNSDDGVEFFGGNVNVKYLVLTGNDDDSIDTDNGYQGSIQHAIVVQRENGGDNIVEASSVAPGTTPSSDAKIANFTFVGNRSNAFRLNSGTIGKYVNGVVNYAGGGCFRWEDSAGDGVAGYVGASDPNFKSVLFDCSTGLNKSSGSDNAAVTAALADDANNTQATNSLASVLFPGPVETGVTPFDAATLSSELETTTYIGAFGPEATETSNWAAGWTFGLFEDKGCPTGTTDSGLTLGDKTVCQLSGTLTTDVRLTRGNVYEIDGRVNVGIDVGADGTAADGDTAILTIESGVTLFGDSGADYMVVNRGSKIFSNGTAADPVVFTSELDLAADQSGRENAIGEWGGLVLLGRAPINRCLDASAPGSAGCNNVVEGVTAPEAVYGGNVSDDSSGALNYTLVKHAGFEVSTGKELNGISFGGVGSGTVVDYIQVHNNSDDGVEFFGGTVNVKHLVLTGNDDDSIDTDNGYQGTIQYAIVTQREDGGDNIVEASSVAPGTAPLSNAKISNFTFIGNRSNAFRLNSGTVGRYVNGVVSFAGGGCFRWEGTAGDGVAGYSAAVDPNFGSVLFDCSTGLNQASGSDNAAVIAALADNSNNTQTTNTLTNTFVNGASESAVTAFDVTTLSSDLEAVDYIGAVKDANDTWWKGWSCGLEASDPC